MPVGGISVWPLGMCEFRPAEQDNPYNKDFWGAELAVDGRYTDLSAHGGQCTISAENKTSAIWRVDLGGVLSIHYIFIQYRTDNVAWTATNGYTARFLGYSVYISNSTNKDEGVLCFKDSSYTRTTIPNPTNITCITHGRYVIYYNNRTHPPYPAGYSQNGAFTELCELEVYECPDGWYGSNCQEQCNVNCGVPYRCDRVTGQCEGGCQVGWKGVKCDTHCNGGQFGQNCSSVCGHCLDKEQCHYIHGTCSNGCDDGYQGRDCTQVCKNNTFGSKCSFTCGNCIYRYGEQCHHETGQCPRGCDVGFHGDRCDQGIDS
uniref:Endothelial cells scavenger receptor n=1 Tax=Magallana gigas TaxID=29159 RepID=K1RQT6_MAGGI